MSFRENTVFRPLSVQLSGLLHKLFEENKWLKNMLEDSAGYEEFVQRLWRVVHDRIANTPALQAYLAADSHENFRRLQWPDLALLRLHDYLKFEGKDIYSGGAPAMYCTNSVFYHLWQAAREGKQMVHPDFVLDLIHLFAQLDNRDQVEKPDKAKLEKWMQRHPDGLQEEIVALRQQNKERIINILIREIEQNARATSRYRFEEGLSRQEKYDKVSEWWNDYRFHLRYAVRKPELLNEMLDYSLPDKQMKLFEKARQKGIPFFVNPYYLSLVLVRPPEHLAFADKTIRDYIFYSDDLVQEFGRISAWEKEDKVEAGKPNAAGWLLPNSRNIHRRYPEVAIFIPDSMGRACGGLCVSCQRMYDFQRGNLNFNLDKLKPNASWPVRLRQLMDYFEQDTQLRDILITGGDALMSSTTSLQNILDAVLAMARRKKAANKLRAEGKKYAEIQRIRIGTRLPVYLPQRIDDTLVQMLKAFRAEALKAGVEELVIQMHFESPMELTPDALAALKRLNATGWLLVNQQVFTAAASRRAYAARLRQMLNDAGVIPYYTFTVKGFRENRFNFAPNARSVQEMVEEKCFGYLQGTEFKDALIKAENKAEFLKDFRAKHQLPFIATDRNVFNLPAVGKSMNFRVVGLTADGRRILMFKHDRTRKHSPSVNPDEEIFLIESKSVAAYLRQLEAMGEDPEEYRGIFGYSAAFTEERAGIFRYKEQQISITSRLTNWQEQK